MKFARKTSLFTRYIAKIVAECYFILTIKILIARMRYQKFNKHLRNVEFHLHWASKLLFWVMMNVSIVSRMWENTSTIELTDESVRAKSDFPRLRPLQHFPRTLSNARGLFFFLESQRRVYPRSAPFCTFLTKSFIFCLQMCYKIFIDIFPIMWYNKYVKRNRVWTAQTKVWDRNYTRELRTETMSRGQRKPLVEK